MKRTKGEIIGAVLEVCLIGSSKTTVVYGTNLNFRRVVPYLDSLIKHGFIAAIDGDHPKYKTTDRGRDLLARIKDAHEFF